MLLDRIKDFRENFVEKVKNPFGGTLILSWSFHNWRLVFSLFNFDSGKTLDEKLKIVSGYLHTADGSIDYWKLLLCPILTAMAAIAGYQLCVSIAQVITSVFNNYIKPLFLSKVKDYTLVTQKRYQSLNRSFLSLRAEHENARDELSEAYKEVGDVKGANSKLFEANAELRGEMASQKEEFEKKLVEKDEIIRTKTDLQLKAKRELDEERRNEVSENITDIFGLDIWTNTYTYPNGSKGEERFNIQDGNKYVIDGRIAFRIENARIDRKRKVIYFEKVDPENPQTRLGNTLLIQSSWKLVGYEQEEIVIVYTNEAKKQMADIFKNLPKTD